MFGGAMIDKPVKWMTRFNFSFNDRIHRLHDLMVSFDIS